MYSLLKYNLDTNNSLFFTSFYHWLWIITLFACLRLRYAVES